MANSPTAAAQASPRRPKGSVSSQRHRLLLIVLAFALLAATMLQYGYLMATVVPPTTAKQSTAMLSDFVPLNKNLPGASREVTSKWTDGVAASAAGRKQRVRGPNYHVIFSTSCVPLQHWQSYLFFYSAMKVGQPGNVTRIASGCTPEETRRLREFHSNVIQRMSDRFHIHFTPDYSAVKLEKGVHPFKYMNKPYGVRNFLEQVLGIEPKAASRPATIPRQYRDDVVMLLDPDMVLLRPLKHDFTHEEVLWVTDPPATKVVRHGHPISQQDGYLGLDWIGLNWAYITNRTKGQFLKPPPPKDGNRFWIAGPPYLATVKDMYNIAELWTEYSPRVLDLVDDIFAEMFGFIIAAFQLKLPHTFVKSIVVSVTDADVREGWKYIDDMPSDRVCEVNDVPMAPSARMPIALHYCQRYFLGEYFFLKYRVKKNIMDCNQSLYLLPPKDILQRYNYSVVPKRADGEDKDSWVETRERVGPRRAKREAFMLCRMINYLNEAVRYLKNQTCPGRGNQNETRSVYLDPADW